MLLLLLSSSTGQPIKAMNKEIVLAKDMSKEFLISSIKELPRELGLYIISLVLQNSLGYRFSDVGYKFSLFKQLDVTSPFLSETPPEYWVGLPQSGTFSPKGDMYFTKTTYFTNPSNNIACIWDSKTGKLITSFKGHTHYISSVAFSPDQETILTGSGDKSARVWNVKTGKLLTTFLLRTCGISAVAYSPKGETLLTCGGLIRLWDAKKGELIHIFKGPSSGVSCVAYSPNEEAILTGTYEGAAYLWNSKTGQLLLTLTEEPSAPLTSVTWSPSGETCLTASDNTTACLWNSKTGKLLHTLTMDRDSTSVAFNPTGEIILIGTEGGTACLWNAETGDLLTTLEGHADSVDSVVFSPDGRSILIGLRNQTICVWKLLAGFENWEQQESCFKDFKTYSLLLLQENKSDNSLDGIKKELLLAAGLVALLGIASTIDHSCVLF